MGGLVQQFSKFGAGRLAAMLMVTAALLGFFGYVIFRFSQPSMGLLYSDLSLQDAAQVVKDLEARNIKYEARGDGQTIMAPRDMIPRLRMELASKGLPSGGGVGYEIFDKGDAFSSTSFVQNINHLRALEGELTRTIRSIGRVQNARVHLVMPERKLFERDREPPRASIVLKLRGDLDAGQIRAIRHLVASAVEGLKPERVSIVDEGGRLLADGAQGENASAGVGADERQNMMERRLKAQIEEIVASVVGGGRSRVQVNAQLEMNRVESRSETFDPESRVARSTQSRTESSQNNEAREQGVTVGNELPGAQGQGAQQGQTREATSKNEEVTNFEISRTTRTEVLEGGRLRRLSVAVLVDGVYARAATGAEAAYQPRTQEELDRIGALVRTAIGFDRQRGDQVEVVNLRFADAPAPVEVKELTMMQQLFSFTKDDMLRGIELGVIALLTLIVLMTVVRPLLKQILASDNVGRSSDGGSGEGGGMIALPTADGQQVMVAVPGPNDSPSERMLALAQIKGQIKAQSVDKIGNMVQQNPTDSVAVIRTWVHDQPVSA
ncbi:MAG: flagellar basal-body MS-ring/collar protein FliF [Bosea sp. (in: a-proteobacteria)]